MPSSSFTPFCGFLRPTRPSSPHRPAADVFTDVTGAAPSLVVETPGYECLLRLDATDRQAKGAGLNVVVHGELYHDVANAAAYVATRYADEGARFAAAVNGSFCMVVADEQRDRIMLVTDRLNTRRLFAAALEGGTFFSAELHEMPLEERDLDITGLAWYLSNGVVHGNRTIYDGVSVLERAHIHTAHVDGLRSEPYWTVQFDVDAAIDEETLTETLGDHLVRSVRRRLLDDVTPVLSLSGGYDATALLGVLGQTLKVSDVMCFSYAVGRPRHKSDESCARQMAQRTGYTHTMLQGYDGDLDRHIRDNARMGQGSCNCCDEVDAWRSLARHLDGRPRPAIFTGDEWMGWDDWSLSSMDDVLRSVQLFGTEGLQWLAPYVSEETLRQLQCALRSDVDRVLSRVPDIRDLHDAKDFLYLDQRLTSHILPWRTCFGGRVGAVRTPLLDNHILDFMMRVPTHLRRDKRLFRKTAERLYPMLFDIPRARVSNYGIPLTKEFRRHDRQVHRSLDRTTRLDDYVTPAALRRLLDDVTRWNPVNALVARGKSMIKPWIPMSVVQKSRRLTPTGLPSPTTDQAILLRRVLVLREALQRG